MTPTKEQMKAFYAQSAERALEAYEQLGQKEWDKKASDHWTAKEHLAYTVGTLEEEHLPVTHATLAGEPTKLPGFETREDEPAFRRAVTEKFNILSTVELIPRLSASIGDHACPRT